MRLTSKRVIVTAGLALSLGIAVWIVFSLRNDDSALSVLVRAVSKKMGWSAPATTAEVLLRMSQYVKKGRSADAVKAGLEWTQKHPDSASNGWIYTSISKLYLEKAKRDSGNIEEDVGQAIVYRDKALPFEKTSPVGLRDLASISELAGDLSGSQRCVQYGNATGFLERTVLLLDERVPPPGTPETRPDGAITLDEIKAFSDSVGTSIARVKGKLQSSGC